MNIIGEVVKIKLETDIKKKEGGSYPGWSLTYEDNDGEVKTVAKHANSLKYNAALKNGLEDLKVGDDFTLEMIKEGDFWNPKNIYKGKVVTEASAPAAANKGNKASSGGGSTYPTADERKVTQKQIVRQSCLNYAVNLVNGSKALNGVAAVISTAREFEAFVHDVPFDDGSIEAMPNDDVEIE